MNSSYLKMTLPLVGTVVAKGAAATTIAASAGPALAVGIVVVAAGGAYYLATRGNDSQNLSHIN